LIPFKEIKKFLEHGVNAYTQKPLTKEFIYMTMNIYWAGKMTI